MSLAASMDLREVLTRQLRTPEVTIEESDVLRACLAAPAEASEAWRRGLDRLARRPVPASRAEPAFPRTVHALLPLLADRLALFETPVSADLVSQLRAARTLELARNEALRAIAGVVLAHPAIASRRPVLLGGLVLAQGVWPEPLLRHTSRLAVLLPSPRAATRAATALAEAGLVAAPRRGDWGGTAMRLRHPSGMPVILHGGACSTWAPHLSYERLAAHAVAGVVDGVDVLQSRPSACFTLTAIAALRQPAGSSLLWLADAVFLLRRTAGEIAESELATGGPLLARLAATQLAARAAEIDPALAADPAVGRVLSLVSAAEAPGNLMAAVAALRGLRRATAVVPGRWARLGWLCRFAPPVLAARLRRRLVFHRFAARPSFQGM